MPRNALVQIRRDTAANWTSVNPTLAAGEQGFETDTGKFKIGTGSTAWTSLLYVTDASDITGTFTSITSSGPVTASGYVEKWLINTIDTSIGNLSLNASTNTSYLYTMPQTSNFTLNVRGNASTTLNNTMATGDQLTITFIYNNSSATWYPLSFYIDGVSQYPFWQGGVTLNSGLTNFNALVFTIVKTGNAGFTIFASQTRFN